jgi:hypothetical protein
MKMMLPTTMLREMDDAQIERVSAEVFDAFGLVIVRHPESPGVFAMTVARDDRENFQILSGDLTMQDAVTLAAFTAKTGWVPDAVPGMMKASGLKNN